MLGMTKYISGWKIESASIQGHNIHFISLLTMGENWHNNHHAFPHSAKLGLLKGQWDPGWWMLLVLQKLGLASDFVLPEERHLTFPADASPVNKTI
jgi:stearoyl-CoA desaturase (delta-9 desaturase)